MSQEHWVKQIFKINKIKNVIQFAEDYDRRINESKLCINIGLFWFMSSRAAGFREINTGEEVCWERTVQTTLLLFQESERRFPFLH